MHGSRRRKSGDAAPSQGPYVGRLSSTLVALRYGGGKQAVVPSMCRQSKGGPDGSFLLVWPFPLGLASIRNDDFDAPGPCAHTRGRRPRCDARGG